MSTKGWGGGQSKMKEKSPVTTKKNQITEQNNETDQLEKRATSEASSFSGNAPPSCLSDIVKFCAAD